MSEELQLPVGQENLDLIVERTNAFYQRAANDIETLFKKFDNGEIDRIELMNQLIHDRARSLSTSLVDPLTDIGNRRFFQTEFSEVLERANRDKNPKSFSLVLIDIDNFKEFNDRHGHDVGDKVLKNVSNVIAKSVRTFYKEKKLGFGERVDKDTKVDKVFIVDSEREKLEKEESQFEQRVHRWGGEEIDVILRNIKDPDVLMDIMERIRNNVADMAILVNGEELKVTISLGGAVYKKGEDPESFYKDIDKEMYKSKNEGRNRANVR